MIKEIKFIVVMALILVGGSLTMAYSQTVSPSKGDAAQPRADFPPPPPGDRGRGPRGGGDMYQDLALTEFQKDQIGALRFNSMDASREAQATIRTADEQLRAMVDSGSFDIDKAKPLIQAKADAMAAVELNRLIGEAAIQRVLTTEQRAQLAQIKERRPPVPPGRGFGPPPER